VCGTYPIDTGLSLWLKRPGSEADHSAPYSAEVKNAWGYTSIPQCNFIARYLGKNKNSVTYTYQQRKLLSISILIKLRTGRPRFGSWPPRSDRYWGSPTLFPVATSESSPWGEAGGATHHHLVPRFRMRGPVPPISNTSSWRGTYLSIIYVFMA